MYFKNSTLVLLLVGALGLSSAYYFPDGPPNQRPGRPARQASPDPSQGPPVPEPKVRPGRPARQALPDPSQEPPVPEPRIRPGRPALEARPGRPAIEIEAEYRPGRPARASEPDNRPGRPAIAPEDRPGRPALAPEDRPGRPALAPEDRPGRPALAPEDRPGRPARAADPSPVPIPLREARQVIDISDPNEGLPEPNQDGSGDEPKPEPRFDGLHIVPRRKDLNIQSKQASSCQMNYAFTQSGTSATVRSPRYPQEYPNNAQSSLCFSSPDGTQMQVTCSDFNLESQRSCLYDYIGLGLSGSPDASSLTKYCGKGAPTATSTGNSLAFVFKSDSSNPGSTTQAPYRFSCTITVTGSSTPSTTAAPATTGRPGSGNSTCTCGQRNTRIVGGTVAQPNSLPWRCYLKTNRYSFFCGCSVISSSWIMTAAHCTRAVMPLQSGDKLYVVVGDHDRSTSTDAASQQIEVTSYVDHPAYNPDTMDNDMSLLKLASRLTMTNTISPVCLPWNYASDNFQGTNVTGSGWGTTSEGGSVSNQLREVDLPVLTTEECAAYMPGQITQNMICTYLPGKDTCQGDSGGSVDLARGGRYYAIGVVSWGIGCARRNYPGVYAKTTKYLDWIQTTASGETFCKA